MVKKIYFWACDYSSNSGEGILGRSYIRYISKNNKSIKLININRSSKFQKNKFKKNSQIYKSVIHKYIYPLIGLIYLWKLYFQSKNVLFLNYTPLWNFLIFIFLPPNSKIGPITGTIIKTKYSFLINLCERVSLLVIKLRFKKIIFSNNFYRFKYKLRGKKFEFNFILKDYRKNSTKCKKLYDFVIYYRNLSVQYNNYIFKLIYRLKKDFKIAVIGDKIQIKNLKNFGLVDRNRAKQIISNSSFAINNPENLYSYFFQDCMSYGLIIFYNKVFKKYNIFKNKKLISISNYDVVIDYNRIRAKILSYKKF